MCLVSYKNIPNISTSIIECYKVLTDDLVSPFQKFKFVPNVLTKDNQSQNFEQIFDIYYLIEKGYFHCCLTYQSAKIFIDKNQHKFKEKLKIYKAIIPKDSLYFINIIDTEICSNQLIIKDEV